MIIPCYIIFDAVREHVINYDSRGLWWFGIVSDFYILRNHCMVVCSMEYGFPIVLFIQEILGQMDIASIIIQLKQQ